MRKTLTVKNLAWFLIQIILIIIFIHQSKITWREYQTYKVNKNLAKKVDYLVKNNKELQLKLLKLEDQSQIEVRVRQQLLLGLGQEKVYFLAKTPFKPPVLREVKLIQ